MTSLIRRLTAPVETRDSLPLPFQDWVNYFNFNNVNYPFLTGYGGTSPNPENPVPQDYTGIVSSVYRSNGIIFALMTVRMMHFAQVRFQFRQLRGGKPGDLFGTQALQPLEVPWVNGTTGDLLARMIQDIDLAGNAYVVSQGQYLARLRPDWVSILMGSRTRRDNWIPGDADTEVIAYIYHPGGPGGKADDIVYLPEQVAHWHPNPDPIAVYRGMSWVTSILREVQGDTGMTLHKNKFLENGATVNMSVNIPTDNLELFERWVSKLRDGHQGLANAYKMMFLGAGATVTPVGSSMVEMDFATVQSAGETRMAAVAGVPPILVGFTEGLKGSSLNSGNYQTARRRFADGTIIPLWQSVSSCLASIISVPSNSQLWFDTIDAAFMKDDTKDEAEIMQIRAATALQLINSGYEPDAIVAAIAANDFTLLAGKHTGLTSVQLQPPADEGGESPIPGPEDDVTPPEPSDNGDGSQNGVASHPPVPAQSGAK